MHSRDLEGFRLWSSLESIQWIQGGRKDRWGVKVFEWTLDSWKNLNILSADSGILPKAYAEPLAKTGWTNFQASLKMSFTKRQIKEF